MGYKIFIPISYRTIEGTQIPSGLYDVIADNQEYDMIATKAIIEVDNISYQVDIIRHCAYCKWNPEANEAYAFNDSFGPQMLDKEPSEDEMLSYIEPLRPYYLSIDEYINGSDKDDWKGFKSIKEAYLACIVNEWSYHPISKKQMDEIFYRSIF